MQSPNGGIIDFVVTDGLVKIAVEVKLNLNFKVIEQAYHNKYFSNYSYIAIKGQKNRSFGYQICEKLGIGVLEYSEFGNTVREVVKPVFLRGKSCIRLHDWQKKSISGSKNERMTAFSNTVWLMERYIKRHKDCSLNECLNNIDHHYENISSAKSSIYNWLKRGIIKNIYLKNGKLFLRNEI